MEPFVRRFIRSSLIWFAIGGLLGVYQIARPFEGAALRPAHMHANLLGFVSMMIFGVAYHTMPRFVGAPLHSRRLAALHLWLANAGLAGLVAGWGVRLASATAGRAALAAGALFSAAGGALFVYNLWRTLDAASTPASRGGKLPVAHAAPGRKIP
ncbi:MAG: cbb3-type cytochrome c oxidase subunit I [Gemmatimonadetes bacterium]|nr:cbb3-type cytochrome c oxidase subunit I [Gemmatimonadota bacterium]